MADRQRMTKRQREVFDALQASRLLSGRDARVAERLVAKGYARKVYDHGDGSALFVRVASRSARRERALAS